MLNDAPIELAMRQMGSGEYRRSEVTAIPPLRARQDTRPLRAIVNRLLGLRIDLTDWYQMAAADARLHSLAESFRGMKPPRFPTMFEAVVNAFACQQLSLEVGLELLNRLGALCRQRPLARADAPFPFPEAREVARLSLEKYLAIGLSHQKAQALLSLARAISRGKLDLECLAHEADAVARQRLLELRGVGRWSAEYVLFRGLGRLDVFPGDDVGAQKGLARWLGRSQPLDYAAVRRVAKPWQPFAGMVYLHLLLKGLSQAGVLKPPRSVAQL